MYPGFPYAYFQMKSQESSSFLINTLLTNYTNEKDQEMKRTRKRIKGMREKITPENQEEMNKKIAKLEAEASKEFPDWVRRNWMTEFDSKVRNCFYFSTQLLPKDLRASQALASLGGVPLYDPAQVKDQGLNIIKDFLSKEEEAQLVDEIYKHEFENLSMRRVQNFGYRFIFGPNLVKTDKPIDPIPEQYSALFEKMPGKGEPTSLNTPSDSTQTGQKDFDQLTITEYKPGEGAKPFIESHKTFEETIALVSLRSDSVMRFQSGISGETFEVLIPQRSLLLLSSKIRFEFSQGIPDRKIDKLKNGLLFRKHRVTLTFRKTKKIKGCDCGIAEVCDDTKAKGEGKETLEIFSKVDKEEAKDSKMLDFEKEHVENVYNNIAEHFSHTRYKPWPKVLEYLMSLPKGSFVGDIGCGNGKYIFCGTDHHFLGVDVAVNFAKICRSKNENTQVLVADSSNLPLKSDILDHAISIAVIHHFVSHGNLILSELASDKFKHLCIIKDTFIILNP